MGEVIDKTVFKNYALCMTAHVKIIILKITVWFFVLASFFVMINTYVSDEMRVVINVMRERDVLFSDLEYSYMVKLSDSEYEHQMLTTYEAIQRGIVVRQEVGAQICPPAVFIYAMLASEEFIRQKCTIFAQEKGSYGDFYRKLLVLRSDAFQNRKRYHALFSMYYAWSADTIPHYYSTRIVDEGMFFRPLTYRLREGHQTALDLFFTETKILGDEQIGPSIYSYTPGIIVAAAREWTSDVTTNAGGLSPHSGNGVIVFDPFSERYYFYFHMYNVVVVPGQIVRSGTLLGQGGNTGINARKPNKGEHLHLEIFDCKRDDFLTVYQIKEIIYDSYFE